MRIKAYRSKPTAGTQVAYLGPPGTYSHLVAEKRFGRAARLVPKPSILDVCEFVSGHNDRLGIIPIENSSGGAIYETVDILLHNHPRIHIEEELFLDVKLALLGHRGEKIKVLYSHFAPLEHCETWVRTRLPHVEKRVVSSTGAAAQQASMDVESAALGNRRLAEMYGLKIVEYPVQADMPNVTVFLTIAGRKRALRGKQKTTLAVRLPNKPGSLCRFLEAFRDEDVNLSRLISRPIRGCPREYAFLVDVQGSEESPNVKRALRVARCDSDEIRVVGSFPTRAPYSS